MKHEPPAAYGSSMIAAPYGSAGRTWHISRASAAGRQALVVHDAAAVRGFITGLKDPGVTREGR